MSSEPEIEAYIGELWDNIEVGKKYILRVLKPKEIEILNISDDKRAVQIKYQNPAKNECWVTADYFIQNLIDGVDK